MLKCQTKIQKQQPFFFEASLLGLLSFQSLSLSLSTDLLGPITHTHTRTRTHAHTHEKHTTLSILVQLFTANAITTIALLQLLLPLSQLLNFLAENPHFLHSIIHTHVVS